MLARKCARVSVGQLVRECVCVLFEQWASYRILIGRSLSLSLLLLAVSKVHDTNRVLRKLEGVCERERERLSARGRECVRARRERVREEMR